MDFDDVMDYLYDYLTESEYEEVKGKVVNAMEIRRKKQDEAKNALQEWRRKNFEDCLQGIMEYMKTKDKKHLQCIYNRGNYLSNKDMKLEKHIGQELASFGVCTLETEVISALLSNGYTPEYGFFNTILNPHHSANVRYYNNLNFNDRIEYSEDNMIIAIKFAKSKGARFCYQDICCGKLLFDATKARSKKILKALIDIGVKFKSDRRKHECVEYARVKRLKAIHTMLESAPVQTS